MTNPLVSIIIPCFNAEKTIGEAIQSALDQTYMEKEVIVINDGSTDGSLNVIRSFSGRIRWESQPNYGAPVARNRAVRMAEGEMIQFLDADDLLYPDKLEKQITRLREVPADIVFCDRIEKVPNDRTGKIISRPMKASDDAVIYLLEGTLQTSAPIHKKKILMKIGGFRENLPCAQEFDLHLRLAAEGYTFHHMNVPLYELRKRELSVSSSYEHILDQYESIIQPVMEQLRAREQMTAERRLAFSRLMGNAGRLYMQMGARQKASQAFRTAQQIDAKGWLTVYDKPARILRRIIGPYLLEQFVSVKREIAHHENS